MSAQKISPDQARPLVVLGIESSCDETAAAVVRRTSDGTGSILASSVFSQDAAHAPYGGVVPEIAARAHVTRLDGIIAGTMRDAGLDFGGLDAVAATAGPGLIGGVIVGLMTAKSMAQALALPFVAVNHLEGHALTAGLTDGLPFPYLLLLVSGGHTQLLSVRDVGVYERFGTTIDDAVGEAFDKTAKLLGLGFPGGPAVERCARGGDATAYDLPRPLVGQDNCNFSFSGLKTALRRAFEQAAEPDAGLCADLCASFQRAVAECLCERTERAMARFVEGNSGTSPPALVIAGGVAANAELRAALADLCASTGFRLVCPPRELCTDNAAMIAWAGAERLHRCMTDGLDTPPRARWPLDPSAEPAAGAGAKA